MIKITKKQRDMLWGVNGPYSEAKISILSKILDDKVNRIFIEVDLHINPTTFEICKSNIDKFKDDIMLFQLLNHSSFISEEYGYKTCAFSQEYINDSVMEKAENALRYSEEAIIKLHKYVMEFLDIK